MRYRLVLFRRHGMSEPEAEATVDRLLQRDRDRDDRRMCAECANLQRDHEVFGRGCFAARQGQLPGVSTRSYRTMWKVLQRCPSFRERKPS